MENTKTLCELPEHIQNSISPDNHFSKPRLKTASRNQIEMVLKSLDDLLPPDHLVRYVWKYVEGLNLSTVLKKIRSVEGNAGRPATDPKIMLALWLFATLKGIGSARMIDEYCKEHDAFKWICGGITVNYHTISDFRSCHGEQLDELLTQSVAILAHKKLISLEKISQDGMRVRACAGGSSFKREESLRFNLELAQMLVNDLKAESEKNPAACKKRIEAAQLRVAEEKVKNIESALAELNEIRRSKILAKKREQRKMKTGELEKVRASMTDPEARIMKMADGGFRPAYNIQYATTNKGKAIVGVSITKNGSDQKETLQMIEQIENRYCIIPKKWIQDGGYHNLRELDKVGEKYKDCQIYMPVQETQKNRGNLYEKREDDTPITGEWRERMGTEEAKEIYKERGYTAELINAQARNRGCQRLLVKGLLKVKNIALLYALVQNMMLAIF